jgi:phosphomannomutase
MKYDYAHLQNGSDIRGVADLSIDGETITLDQTAVSRLAQGFLYFLTITCGKNAEDITIAIGRDSRNSGEMLLDTAKDALLACGARIMDSGLSSTPAMFMATIFSSYQADGAIMLTASHMPKNRNGMKFFTRVGGLDKKDIVDIINFAESDSILSNLPHRAEKTRAEKIDLMGKYSSYLRDMISSSLSGEKTSFTSSGSDAENISMDPSQPLKGLKIAVDAGNGAGGFYAEKVLGILGADISPSRFLEPDGDFPNHIPNPENAEAINALSQSVIASGADLGLIFDTDVDRVSAVDENGKEINRNGIVALASALIASDNPGTVVVTDSVTSPALTDFLENMGLKHLRYKRGYRNVINKSKELNNEGIDSALAIETSGHAAYRDNRFLDDGAYLATKIVIRTALLKAEGKGISSLISELKEPAESHEVRMPINTENFQEAGDRIISYIEALVEARDIKDCELDLPNFEGVRVKFKAPSIDGWILLRKSLHEAIMPLNMEANIEGGCKEIIRVLLPILSGFPELDTSKLEKILK